MTSFIEYYRENKYKKWDYYRLSSNPQVKLENIHELRLIYYNALSSNPNLTWEYVETNKTREWCWSRLSENPCITTDIVLKNPSEPWNYSRLIKNPNINWNDVKQGLKLPDIYIPGEYINPFSNPNITWEFVKNHKFELERDSLISLSSNPNITLKNIMELITDPELNYSVCNNNLYIFESCINNLSSNPSVTWKDITENDDLPWDYSRVSYNPNITMDIIQDNPNYEWSEVNISLNPNITWDFVKQTNYEWNYKCLSMNHMEYFNKFNIDNYVL